MIRALVCMFIALALFGCGFPEGLIDTVKATNEAIVMGEPFAEAGYKTQLDLCVKNATSEAQGNDCIDRTERAWSAYVDTLDGVRKARCKLEPQKCPPDAAPAPSDTTTVIVTERP